MQFRRRSVYFQIAEDPGTRIGAAHLQIEAIPVGEHSGLASVRIFVRIPELPNQQGVWRRELCDLLHE
jgi:hypothetical protein